MGLPKVYFNNHTAKWNYERQNNDDTEYIRADLAEPTWEDIRKIDDIMGDVWHEAKHGDLNENFYQEVLRRFNESRNIH